MTRRIGGTWTHFISFFKVQGPRFRKQQYKQFRTQSQFSEFTRFRRIHTVEAYSSASPRRVLGESSATPRRLLGVSSASPRRVLGGLGVRGGSSTSPGSWSRRRTPLNKLLSSVGPGMFGTNKSPPKLGCCWHCWLATRGVILTAGPINGQ